MLLTRCRRAARRRVRHNTIPPRLELGPTECGQRWRTTSGELSGEDLSRCCRVLVRLQLPVEVQLFRPRIRLRALSTALPFRG